MASSRPAISIVKCLSPRKLTNVTNIERLNPHINQQNKLTVQRVIQNSLGSLHSKIDSPYKKKIITEGITDKNWIVLGNGGFGTVYKVYYKGEAVAAKVIKKNQQKNLIKIMEKEVAYLRHSNIVKILKVDEGPALTLITMELCGNSLQEVLQKNSISIQQKIHIWKSISKALIYCHKMHVIHADVKPKNVLMGQDKKPKLADFGSAVFTNDPYPLNFFHGTPGYAAPEVVQNKALTPSSDIYSLGVLAWQMLSRKSPFEGLHKHTILYLTGKGITPPDKDLADGCNGKYKDLYRKCWNEIPEDRPNLLIIMNQLNQLENNCKEESH
ncbi:hypothetical protein TKK_0007916 [Trichogramma kaykai]|uniref:Protein kinase domain-containing protein n=1 Tax=Trichogramma kaykai TaxID=54128 RepID=A0ABD2X846_9HYME